MSGPVMKKSGKTNGEAFGTPTRSQDVTTAGCLDDSLSMLHNSMERANAYEYLLHHCKERNSSSEDKISSNGNGNTPGSSRKQTITSPTMVKAADGDVPFDPTAILQSLQNGDGGKAISSPPGTDQTAQAQSGWWLKVLHRQEKQHERDRKEWQQHLQESKKHSAQYKNELKDNLQERLHGLERQRVLSSKQQQKNGEDEGQSISRASTGTTYSLGSTTANSVAGEEETTSGLEVSYDSSQAVRKLGILELTYEETVRKHESEREEWVEKLDRAAAVTADGQKLSESMQSQLVDLAEEIQKGNTKQRKQWKERVKALEHLVELTEQQHQGEKTEWQQEKDVLETTVERLASDVQQQATELREEAYENEVLENTVAQLVKDKANLQDRLQSNKAIELSKHHEAEQTQWKHEKFHFENTVARLTADLQRRSTELKEQVNGTSTLNNTVAQLIADKAGLRAECSTLRDQLRSTVSSPPTVRRSDSPRTPSPRRLEWDDKLDRAMVERDLFRQEAEKNKRLLEEVEMLHKRETEEWIGQQDMKKKDWHADTSRQLQELRDEQAMETKRLQQEFATSSDEIYKRYQQSVEKRNELVKRIQTMGTHNSAEKGSWKLRLEAALLESRTSLDARKAVERELEQLKAKHLETIEELRNRLQASRSAAEDELEHFRNQHAQEVEGIRSRLSVAKNDFEDETRKSVEAGHADEVRRWNDRLTASTDETRCLTDRANKQASSLEELQTLRSKEKMKWESKLKKLISENDNCKRELEIYRDTNSSGLNENFKAHQRAVCEAVEELRLDILSIRETLEDTAKTDETLEASRHSEVRLELERIHESLNDAVAELTLETEAILESRTAMKSLAGDLASTFPSAEHQTQSLELQERVADELREVRNQLSKLKEFDSSGLAAIHEANRLQFESELHMKEMALVTCKAQLNLTKKELAAERIAGRRKEVSRGAGVFPVTHDSLEVMLNEALGGSPIKMYSDETYFEDDKSDATTDESTSPMLEEALALAHGLTDIVHGRGDYDQETSVMEMLESLSEMMDQADRAKVQPKDEGRLGSGGTEMSHTAVETSASPMRQDEVAEVRGKDVSEYPPAPVTTPMQVTRHSGPNSLQMVVEQLYRRCQLLESERTDLMEVTLDLLESAREANAAELDAALVTFRENSCQELMTVQKRNQSDKERLYRRLCGSCKHGLLQGAIAKDGE